MQQPVKGFRDAVITFAKPSLEYGVEQGFKAADRVRRLASLRRLAPQRAAVARRLASEIQTFPGDAKSTYGGLLTNSASHSGCRVERLKEALTPDLDSQPATLRNRPATRRWTGLLVLGLTLANRGRCFQSRLSA